MRWMRHAPYGGSAHSGYLVKGFKALSKRNGRSSPAGLIVFFVGADAIGDKVLASAMRRKGAPMKLEGRSEQLQGGQFFSRNYGRERRKGTRGEYQDVRVDSYGAGRGTRRNAIDVENSCAVYCGDEDEAAEP